MKREKLDPSAKMYGCVLEGELAEFIQAQAIEHGLSMREINHDAFEMYMKGVQENGAFGSNTLKAIETKDEREAAAAQKAADKEAKKADAEAKKVKRDEERAAKKKEREDAAAEKKAAREKAAEEKKAAATSKTSVPADKLNPAAKAALEKQAKKQTKGGQAAPKPTGKIKLEQYTLGTAAGLCGIKVKELRALATAGELKIEKDTDGTETISLPADIPATMTSEEILQAAKDIAAAQI